VFAVSSAGVFFTVMGDVPPITLAGWRLQLTAVITLIAGSVQWTTVMSPADRSRWRTDAPLTALSGLALGVHFGLWVWSLQHTSLAHSLLLVSTSPVLNVGVALLLRHAISWGEVAGSLLALAGA
jgi:drug/metabolite transporter (DMT)-like permease